jgi:hypothetical protein
MCDVLDEIQVREVRNSRTNVIEVAITEYTKTKHPDLLPQLQGKAYPS